MKNLAEEINAIQKQLEESSYKNQDPELIIYAADNSWVISFNDGETVVGESIDELLNFVENINN